MPATAGRTRMPAGNRMSSSAALKTNDMWTKTIGYDPYAGEAEKEDQAQAKAEEENTYERAKGIMEVAKLQNVQNAENDTERSTDFAKQLFWGLKRKKAPIGHEYTPVADESSSDSAHSSDDEEERIANAAKQAAIGSGQVVVERKRQRDSSDDESDKKRKKQKKKEKKAKKEKKSKKKHKKK